MTASEKWQEYKKETSCRYAGVHKRKNILECIKCIGMAVIYGAAGLGINYFLVIYIKNVLKAPKDTVMVFGQMSSVFWSNAAFIASVVICVIWTCLLLYTGQKALCFSFSRMRAVWYFLRNGRFRHVTYMPYVPDDVLMGSDYLHIKAKEGNDIIFHVDHKINMPHAIKWDLISANDYLMPILHLLKMSIETGKSVIKADCLEKLKNAERYLFDNEITQVLKSEDTIHLPSEEVRYRFLLMANEAAYQKGRYLVHDELVRILGETEKLVEKEQMT